MRASTSDETGNFLDHGAAPRRRGARAALGVLALSLVAVVTHADTRLTIGVYGDDHDAAAAWGCGRVIDEMERHMTQMLDEDVHIDLDIEQNYATGVAAFVKGEVDLARFPNVAGYWAAHPNLAPPVLEAWRDAMSTMRLEAVPTHDPDAITCNHIVGVLTDHGAFAREGELASQLSISQFLAWTLRPGIDAAGDSLADEINALPPTAAGAPAR